MSARDEPSRGRQIEILTAEGSSVVISSLALEERTRESPIGFAAGQM